MHVEKRVRQPGRVQTRVSMSQRSLPYEFALASAHVLLLLHEHLCVLACLRACVVDTQSADEDETTGQQRQKVSCVSEIQRIACSCTHVCVCSAKKPMWASLRDCE
eukprot:1127772-Pleurochrysis_carterae.AAC.1